MIKKIRHLGVSLIIGGLLVSPVLAAAPDSATDVSATAGNQQVLLQWTNPSYGTGSDPTFDNTIIMRKAEATNTISSCSDATATQLTGAVITGSAGASQSIIDNDEGANLANGTTYQYSIFSLNTLGVCSSAVKVSATPSATVFPDAPGSFAVDSTDTDREITMTWTLNGDSDNVTLRRSTTSAPTSETDGDAIITDSSVVTHTDSNLTNGTEYFYSIFSTDGTNFSSRSSLSVTPADNVAPSAPANPVVTSGDAVVDLSWDTDSDHASITIRKLVDGVLFPTSITDGVAVSSGTSITSFQDTGVSNGVSVNYSIFALDSVGNISSAVNLSALPADNTAPSIVTDFAATAGDPFTDLSWVNPTDADFVGVTVFRHTLDLSGFADFAAVEAVSTKIVDNQDVTSVSDTGLSNDTTYHYAIYANDEVPNPSTGVFLSSTTLSDGTAPSAPTTAVTPFVNSSETQVVINWVDPTDSDLATLAVFRSTSDNLDDTYANILANDGTDGIELLDGTITSTTLTYTDTTITNATEYYYAVFAKDSIPNGSSALIIGPLTTIADTTVPNPVTVSSATGLDNAIQLDWTESDAVDATTVIIYRSTSDNLSGVTYADTVQLAIDNADVAITTTITPVTTSAATTYTDSELPNNTQYFYSLFTLDEVDNPSTGVSVNATTVDDTTAPTKPSSGSVTGGDRETTLTWTNPTDANTGDFVGVTIFRHSSSLSGDDFATVEGTANVVKIVDQQIISTFTDTGLENNTDYFYAIFSEDDVGLYSLTGNSKSTTTSDDITAPDPVTDLVAINFSNATNLTWTNPTTADFATVSVFRSSATNLAGVDYTTAVSTAGSDATVDQLVTHELISTYTDTTIASNTAYTYAIYTHDEVPNASSAVTISHSSLTYDAADNDGQILLSWDLHSDSSLDTLYKLYVSQSATPPATPSDGTLLTSGNNIDSFEHTSLTNGTTYSYSLFLRDFSDNWSLYTSTSIVPADITAPSITDIEFTGTADNAAIDLSWDPSSVSDIQDVTIFRDTTAISASDDFATVSAAQITNTSGEFTIVGTFTSGTSSLSDTGLTNGTTYHYAIFIQDTAGNYSSSSAIASATPSDVTAPSPVTGLSGSLQSDGTYQLTWTNPTDADFDGFTIRRSLNSFPSTELSGSQVIATTDITIITTIDTTVLENGNTYYYSVFTHDVDLNYSVAATHQVILEGITLGDIEVDSRVLASSDFVGLQPTLEFPITFPDNAASSLSIDLSFSVTHSVNGQVIDTPSNQTITDTTTVSVPISIPLDQGTRYILSISGTDNTGATLSTQSVSFQTMSDDLTLTEVLNGPNPFNPSTESTRIQYQLGRDADVSIYIFSISGRKVWSDSYTASSTGGITGLNTVLWNGQDSTGTTVANGVYIAYVIADDGTNKIKRTLKIAVLR